MLSSDIFHDGPPLPLFPQGRRRHTDTAAVLAEVVRMEELLATDVSWPLSVWQRRYLDHLLRQGIARRLIWEFRHPGEERLLFPDTACWRDARLHDVRLAPLAPLPDGTCVRLWHTLNPNWGTFVLWRERFILDGVVTSFEQAHRLAFYPERQELANGTRGDRVVRRDKVCALGRRRGWRHRHAAKAGRRGGAGEDARRDRAASRVRAVAPGTRRRHEPIPGDGRSRISREGWREAPADAGSGACILGGAAERLHPGPRVGRA